MRVSPYPWYQCIDKGNDAIEQGYVLQDCPVFFPPDTLRIDDPSPTVNWKKLDLIIMSQSCDMQVRKDGTATLKHVMLCPLYRATEFEKRLDLKNVSDGRQPPFHLLAPCDLPRFQRGLRIVDFRNVYSLPIGFVREHLRASDHLYLLPPYREHLSQAFARFFMRVGLPSDLDEDDLKRIDP